MKILSVLILAVFTAFTGQHAGNDLDLLFGKRWVVDEENRNLQDIQNIDFLVYEAPGTAHLPLKYKHAGLTFQRDGTLLEHVWNKCGTGNPPDHFKAQYFFEEMGDEIVIKITNNKNWYGNYMLQRLTKHHFTLQRS